jgi:nitrite reductase/ring-hydroxylating ferredoxin subunit
MFGKRKVIKWFKLFSSEEEAREAVPVNTAVKVMLGNEDICLARTASGFYALQNQCPHQGFPLHTGACTEENEIICPYHRYKFDLATGKSHSEQCDGKAIVHPVKMDEKGLYIGTEKEVWKLF